MVMYLGLMNQLTTFSLSMTTIPAEMITIFANMPHLVDIYLGKFGVLEKLPTEFPRSLRCLYLTAVVMKQDPMPVLEKLPCLVVLMLGGYEGQTMSCSAQGFPRLQELQLVKFSMEKWGVEEGTMPKLCRLTLCVCRKLSRLPEGLLHLVSLNHLVLECVPLISEDDTTLNELKQKRCKVA
ncbi:unnamed protein product [Triticum turgidum subsp. durum]|uniref:Disease resistance R13L4/SHOC-2-like LRR domain-containing protein n=1 Tax=Triticum turgidum subsp. durum TaxID=4567 RepID=A0A9R1C658_TRITD|nr:unnamed protein product [Triticum turgidum subsp. durum]